MAKYAAVFLAASFFLGAMLLIRTTDLLWQAGDSMSPGQLVSGIHTLSSAVGLDLFSKEYNMRRLTEEPDPYWVREWHSKCGFAEALQRGLHEAQDRYRTYALLHTYSDDEHAAWGNLTAYKEKNPNHTVKWSIRRMVRGARRVSHTLECNSWEPGLVPALKIVRSDATTTPMPDEKTSRGPDFVAERLQYAEKVRNLRGYCFGAATIPDAKRVCDVHLPNYQVDGTRVLYNTTFAIYPYWHRARAYSDPSRRAGLIAVTTQGTVDRVSHLSNLVRIWQGPVSFAVLATESEIIDELPALLYTDPEVADHVDIHVVYRTQSPAGSAPFYPINMLRNVAMATVWAEHAFVLDIDNIPNADMASYVSWLASAQSAALEIEARNPSECPGLFAFVPPAVEMQATTLEGLYARSQVKKMVPKRLLMEGFLFGDVKPMHMYYAPAYMPTNHYEWMTNSQVVETRYLARHEPYYIARMPIPLFNESFVNRGGNYAQQVYEMNVGGYRFFRMPHAFVIDIPHTHSYDELKKNASLLVDEDHAIETAPGPVAPAANQKAFLQPPASANGIIAPQPVAADGAPGTNAPTTAPANDSTYLPAAPTLPVNYSSAPVNDSSQKATNQSGTNGAMKEGGANETSTSHTVTNQAGPPGPANSSSANNTHGTQNLSQDQNLTQYEKRRQTLHMIVNDAPQQVLNQDFITELWEQLWNDLPHRYQHHIPSADAQEPVFRRYRTTMTKVSNDLFSALSKPGIQDADPNYTVDFNTPQ